MHRFSLLIPLITLLSFINSAAAEGPLTQQKEEALLIKVIDGDTLKIAINGKKENLRLIGIDTPENKYNKKARKDSDRNRIKISNIISMGKKAAQFTEKLVKRGDKLYIEYDAQKRDKYKRLLGYAYTSDGKMLNEEIVKNGYASLMTIPPNVKYAEKFKKAHENAVNKRLGLYSPNIDN